MWPVHNFSEAPRKGHLGIFNITKIASNKLKQKLSK